MNQLNGRGKTILKNTHIEGSRGGEGGGRMVVPRTCCRGREGEEMEEIGKGTRGEGAAVDVKRSGAE